MITVITALLSVMATVSCGTSADPQTPPGRIVVAVSAASIEPQPGMTGAVRDLVARAAAGDAATLDLVVDQPDGPAVTASLDLVPRRGSAVERSADRRRELIAATIRDLDARLAVLDGGSGRIDVLGLLAHIARTPGPVTGVVISSGLQSTGSLAVDSIGWDGVGSDAVLDQAAAARLLPDLTGKTIVFAALGDVVAPQQRLPERLRSRLADMWLGLCARAGAADCRIDTEATGAGAPVSTMPVPVVAVPPDPVLALPAAGATAPAVTELPGDVLFEPGAARLLPDAVMLLRSVAARLPAGAELELVGRTATVGSAESSRAFSLQRALSCKDALVGAGVPADLITAFGLGYDQPLVPDIDPSGRLLPDAAQRNRSVTMSISIGGTS